MRTMHKFLREKFKMTEVWSEAPARMIRGGVSEAPPKMLFFLIFFSTILRKSNFFPFISWNPILEIFFLLEFSNKFKWSKSISFFSQIENRFFFNPLFFPILNILYTFNLLWNFWSFLDGNFAWMSLIRRENLKFRYKHVVY